jgi:hypothetical protein
LIAAFPRSVSQSLRVAAKLIGMETPIRPRLWPAWVLIIVAAALVAATPFLVPRTMLHFLSVIGGPVLATLGILLWWVVGSRANGLFRWWPVLVFVVYG